MHQNTLFTQIADELTALIFRIPSEDVAGRGVVNEIVHENLRHSIGNGIAKQNGAYIHWKIYTAL